MTARTLGFALEIPVYGVCSLDVLAVEAVATGAVDQDFVVATDARRKEVYLASYDERGARLDGPVVGRPADLATDVPAVGPGAARTSRRSPAGGSDRAERRLAGAHRRRGARRAARPRAALPAPPDADALHAPKRVS